MFAFAMAVLLAQAAPAADTPAAKPAAPAAATAAPAPAPAAAPAAQPSSFFPLLGDAARKTGRKLPPAWGINLNTVYYDQDVNIGAMKLSVNDNPLQDIDFIHFQRVQSKVLGLSLRPNLWLFPFLNVYGLFTYGRAETIVDIDQPVTIHSDVKQNSFGAGFGGSLAAGMQTFFLIVDLNANWAKLEKLADPVFAFTSTLRGGKRWDLGDGAELQAWIGTMYQGITVGTIGKIGLAEALGDAAGSFGNALLARCDSLKPLQKPVCQDLANKVLAAGANASINYQLDKALMDPWNIVVGGNYAIDRHVHFRAEVGFLHRIELLMGVEYRFDGP